MALSREGCEKLGKACAWELAPPYALVQREEVAQVSSSASAGAQLTHWGSVLLLTHCNQRDETASPLKYHSCQHLKVNSSPHICVKKGTVITTTFF